MIFVDGIGVSSAGSGNPLAQGDMPYIFLKNKGALTAENANRYSGECLFRGIDAKLDTAGVPQSATGQTALMTGINAASYLNMHLPAFPNQELCSVIREHSLLRRLREKGKRVCFANAYQPEYFMNPDRPHSVTTLCSLAANVPFLKLEELKNHQAVYWDITNQLLTERGHPEISRVSPLKAGKTLATIARKFDFTLFETYEADLIGHRMEYGQAAGFLRKFDEFIQGILMVIDSDFTLLIISDHGNLEDLSTGSHTDNPALLLAFGKQARAFAQAESLTDVTPLILSLICCA
jgi:hypothetical protein